MRVLVLGSTGVLGKPTVRELVSQGHEVVAAVRRSPTWAPARTTDGGQVERIELDLFDATAMRRAAGSVDAVLHLATAIPPATASRRRSAWTANDRLRRDATRLLLDAAAEVGGPRLVMQSVTFTLADGGSEWLDETATVRRDAPVLASALDAENLTMQYADRGHPGVVLRLPVLYGPEAPSTGDALRFAGRGIAPVVGARSGWVTFVHTEDAARALVAALEPPSGIYHAWSDPIRKGAFADALAPRVGRGSLRVLPAAVVPWFVGPAARPFTRSHRISSARLFESTAWRPHHPDPVRGWAEVIGRSTYAHVGGDGERGAPHHHRAGQATGSSSRTAGASSVVPCGSR